MRKILLAILLMALPASANAQTPNTTYTFTSDDVYRTLAPNEQVELESIQEELRELQETGRSLKEGSPSRRAVLTEFERVKAERDEKFGFIRGLNGSTITFWGEPFPNPVDILSQVVSARRSTYTLENAGMLFPHWYYNETAAIVGAMEPPEELTAPIANEPVLALSDSDLPLASNAQEGEGCEEASYLFGTSVLECDN